MVSGNGKDEPAVALGVDRCRCGWLVKRKMRSSTSGAGVARQGGRSGADETDRQRRWSWGGGALGDEDGAKQVALRRVCSRHLDATLRRTHSTVGASAARRHNLVGK